MTNVVETEFSFRNINQLPGEKAKTVGRVFLEPFANYGRGSGQVWSTQNTNFTTDPTGQRGNVSVTLSQRFEPTIPQNEDAQVGIRYIYEKSGKQLPTELAGLQTDENKEKFKQLYLKENGRTADEQAEFQNLYKVFGVGSYVYKTVKPTFAGNNVQRSTVSSSSSLNTQNTSIPLYSYNITSDLEVRTGDVTSTQSAIFSDVLSPNIRSRNGTISLILTLKTQDFATFDKGVYNFFSDSAFKNSIITTPVQNNPLYKLIGIGSNQIEIGFSLNLSSYVDSNFPVNFPLTIRLYGFISANARDIAQSILNSSSRTASDEQEVQNLTKEWRFKEYRFSFNLVPATLPINPRNTVNTITNTSNPSTISSAIALNTPDPGSFSRIISRGANVLLFNDVERVLIPNLRDDTPWEKTLIRARVLDNENREVYQNYIINGNNVDIPVLPVRGRINLTPLYVRSESDLQRVLAGSRNLPNQAAWGQTFNFDFEKVPRTTTTNINDPADIIGKLPLPNLQTRLNYSVPEGNGVIASRPTALASGVDVATRVKGRRVRLRLDTGNTSTVLDAVKVEKNSALVGYFEDKSIVETQLLTNEPTVFTITPVRFANTADKSNAVQNSQNAIFVSGTVPGSVSPNYRLFVSTNRVTEGQSFSVTLDTDFVEDNTNVGYKIFGIGVDDILEPLTGEFVVVSGTATKSFTVLKDYKIEGTQLFQLVLNNQQASASVLIQDIVFNYSFDNVFPEFDVGLFEFDEVFFGRL